MHCQANQGKTIKEKWSIYKASVPPGQSVKSSATCHPSPGICVVIFTHSFLPLMSLRRCLYTSSCVFVLLLSNSLDFDPFLHFQCVPAHWLLRSTQVSPASSDYDTADHHVSVQILASESTQDPGSPTSFPLPLLFTRTLSLIPHSLFCYHIF